MSDTATLQARITLDTSQYQQAAQRVEQLAVQLQRTLENMNATAQTNAHAINQTSHAMQEQVSSLNQNRVSWREVMAVVARMHPALNATAQVAQRTGRVIQTAWHGIATAAKKTWGVMEKATEKLSALVHKTASVISGAFKGAFATATVSATGFFAYMAHQANEARQLLADSVRLNVDTTSLQTWEFAAKKVGIETDKVRDIMKDVNDKLGDFITTGGGEAKDIFEKLSLDAEDFIGLAPDKALEKIAQAAEGLSVQDKTFLFESIADDASLLLPLLEQNATKLKEIKQEALNKGVILSEAELNNLKSFNQTLTDIWDRITGFAKHLAGSLAAPMQILLAEVDKFIQRFGSMDQLAVQAAQFLVDKFTDLVVWISKAGETFQYFGEKAAAIFKWIAEKADSFSLSILNIRAFLYSMADGLAQIVDNLIKALHKFSPVGLAFSKQFQDAIKDWRTDIRGALDEMAREKAEIELDIQPAPSSFEKTARAFADKMKSAMNQTVLDFQAAKASGYAAKSPSTEFDRQRSLSEYQLKQAQAGAEDLKKSTEALKKQLEQEQKSTEKQKEAADKMLRAADKMAGKAEADEQSKGVQLFTGASPNDAKKEFDEEWQRLTELVEQQREAGRKEIAELNKQQVEFNKWLKEQEQQTKENKTENVSKSIDEIAKACASIPEQQAANAVWAENLLRQQEQMTGRQIDLGKAQEEAIRQLAEKGSNAVDLQKALSEQQTQAAQLQVQAAEKMQQAAEQLGSNPNTSAPRSGSLNQPNLTIPPTTQNVNINLSGDIGVKLDGANETVAKAVVASQAFKLGVAEMIKPELINVIRGAVVSVGSPLLRTGLSR